jgi:putative transposase
VAPEPARSLALSSCTSEQTGSHDQQQRRAALTENLKTFHDAFDDVYGSQRIPADLREDAEVVSGKTWRPRP